MDVQKLSFSLVSISALKSIMYEWTSLKLEDLTSVFLVQVSMLTMRCQICFNLWALHHPGQNCLSALSCRAGLVVVVVNGLTARQRQTDRQTDRQAGSGMAINRVLFFVTQRPFVKSPYLTNLRISTPSMYRWKISFFISLSLVTLQDVLGDLRKWDDKC